jgi:3-methyladenine DNA glycosylase Mpg
MLPLSFRAPLIYLLTNDDAACHSFYEKDGWMLIFWNFAGVPYVYSFQSVYILRNGPLNPPTALVVFMFAVLFFAYYMWDTANR